MILDFIFFAFSIVLDTLFSIAIRDFMHINTMIPCATIMCLVLIVKNYRRYDALLISILMSILYSLLLGDSNLIYIPIFVIVAVTTKLWSKNILDSFIELLFFCLSGVLIKELLFIGCYYQYFEEVLLSRLVNTLIFNMVIAVLIIVVYHLKLSWAMSMEYKKMRKENLL